MSKRNLTSGRINQKMETRFEILSAASRLLQKKQIFTIEDVVNESGISRATIYRYFSNIDLLIAEAGLHLKLISPSEIYKNVEKLNFSEQLKGFVTYVNKVTLDNEKAFRQYLSKVILQDSEEMTRAGRRILTLDYILENKDLDKVTRDKLTFVCTLLTGIEPIIVAKDVCNMDNNQAQEALLWALEKILKGLESEN